MKKLLLIDGSNLIFRAYYATENNKIKNIDGVSINAVHTLISMIKKIIDTEKPTHVFIALDSGKETFRHEMFEEYKGGRVATPEQLKAQFPIILEFFNSLGIKNYSMNKYEADDLIATYAKEAAKLDYEVTILSGDKDLLQMVEEKITVITPKLGFSKECRYTPEVFEEKYTFPANRFIEYKALVGDKSDNILGIEKVGDKTAKKFINEYENINDLIKAAKDGEIKGKIGENIALGEEILIKNLELVTLIENVNLEMPLEKLKFDDYDYDKFLNFLKEQGMMKLYEQILEEKIEDKSKFDDFLKFDDLTYEVIDNFEIKKYIDIDKNNFLYAESLKDNYFNSQALGIGIANEKGNFYLAIDNINSEFIDYLKDESTKIIYNYKKLMGILHNTEINGIIFDPYLALSLINYANFSKPLDTIMLKYGIFYLKPFENIYGAKSNPKIPEESLYQKDVISKAQAIKDSYEKIKKEIIELELENVLYNIELPLAKVLAKIELNGVDIDGEKLSTLIKEYQKKNNELSLELQTYTDININSSNQLAKLLFEDWGLAKKGLKRTSTGISTDVNNLEKLLMNLKEKKEDGETYQKEINFVKKILEYRKNSKILNTYLKNIEKFIYKDKKIHPINNQLLSETGRLSVMDPNIQNMPINSEEGQKIRELFSTQTSEEQLIAFDYSQVELRIMAAFSQDESMITAFNNNRDIHEETAKKIFNIEKVTSLERKKAKAINFGIIYGISPYGLAKQVDITNDEAKEFINKYFENFPKIKIFMNETIESVQKTGYTLTLSKRRRYIENISSNNFKEKEHAQRAAINTPIQGSAADILKMAMIEVDNELQKRKMKSIMIMQIHDEIVFKVYQNEKEELLNMVKEVMENIVKLPIKLKVDYGIGENWLQTK